MGLDFVHLRCHNNFSLLEGAATVQQLLEAARARGFRALALTDTNGLYAAVTFAKKAQELGIKPIFGADQGGGVLRSIESGLVSREVNGRKVTCGWFRICAFRG